MLKIQRASAGSGKTYTLAETFILNLIAYQKQNGKWNLRNEKQIEDSLSHILAITFTNKATNEMKTRIIENLSLLSSVTSLLKDSPDKINKIPYLKKFSEITGASFSEIAKTAEIALRTILNEYSNFKISTIDSFFQEILRIFTYEANINDSYQLEIDSGFVVEAALDEAFNTLDSKPDSMGQAVFWLKILMQQEAVKSQRWNIFSKKTAGGSIYAKLRKALYQLESEEYKKVKDTLDNYFSSSQNIKDLPNLYINLKNKAQEERTNLLSNIKDLLDQAENIISINNYTDQQIIKNFFGQAEKIKQLKTDSKLNFSYSGILRNETIFKTKYKGSNDELDDVIKELYTCLDEWDNIPFDSYYKSWKIYGELLPYLGLIIEIRQFLAEILKSNNLIQLSDTSYILKKIIGEDDAPFVFERLGTRLENYLIDEFQDTSRMQWEIIKPLLLEGLAKDKNSLIIGDPKQSIYRFRNADHTLITKEVPQNLAQYNSSSQGDEENTNWRSHTNIVKFNNFFFSILSEMLTQLSRDKGGNGYDFSSLYANVIQKPANNANKGYVEINILSKPTNKADNENDEEDSDTNPEVDEAGKDWFSKSALEKIGPLISSLLEKGYRQNEIAILVNTNEKGKMVINNLIEYNLTLDPRARQIEFISEESLLVSSSPAVNMIIDVIKKISDPKNLKLYEGISPLTNESDNEEHFEEGAEGVPNSKAGNNSTTKKYFNWNEIKVSYNIFSSLHQELPAPQRIMKFLEEEGADFTIPTLIENLPTPSLASLVEAAAKTFLDEELLSSQAIFISAFQDIIAEYASKHHNDPASFLDWWNKKGSKLSINSPDDIDAVQIMTIHKSKGLEFKCVIIPFADDSFRPSQFKQEWRWVAPLQLDDLNLPPVLPVNTSTWLKDSIHEDYYKEYFDQVLTDCINMYYVAFTRAKNELYIFSPQKESNKAYTITDYFLKIFKDSEEEVSSENTLKDSDYLMDENLLKVEDLRISYGLPFTKNEVIEERIKNEKKEEDEKNEISHIISSYTINNQRPRLRSVATREISSPQ
ncbi:MAG: UvrD-helicase domain-containing protein [Muribaculaceae bacterium]|nr:UvrD-helicase domain-containing protein [Muribaculaceae bacterium]